MHIAVPEVGFVTATGIVGGNIALSLGGALSCALRQNQSVAVSVFGDGAAQTGSFHESLNLASLWRLPIVFVCENNGYAEFTPLAEHTNVDTLARHAQTYAIPSVTVDGNDVLAVRDAAAEAVARARARAGCSFVECLTYRWRGHYEGDAGRYRARDEVADWGKRDPILRLLNTMVADARERAVLAEECERSARSVIDVAVEAAFASAEPACDAVLSQVYAQ
jgi:pyruvate dehydrogenase E1 component alpha subunit